jgi:acetyl esterase/lipase
MLFMPFASKSDSSQERVAAAGYAFISADYRLLTPATAHDILEDIKDVFSFIFKDLNPLLSQKSVTRHFSPFHVDFNAVAVAGTSAGGLCAYYAAMHVSPKPKALVCMYAMGGDYVVGENTWYNLTPGLTVDPL